MLKWDKVSEAEKYEVNIEGQTPVTVTTNEYDISKLDRTKERRVEIKALNGQCKSDTAEFVIPVLTLRPSVTVFTRGSNIVFANIIKLTGRHSLKYGNSPQKLDKEIVFNNEHTLSMLRGYFQIDNGPVYYNLSFLPKFCNITAKTGGNLQSSEIGCERDFVLKSDPVAVGYILNYLREDGSPVVQVIQLPSNRIGIEGGSNQRCRHPYKKAIVYPFYQKDGVLCDYGEGLEVELRI